MTRLLLLPLLLLLSSCVVVPPQPPSVEQHYHDARLALQLLCEPCQVERMQSRGVDVASVILFGGRAVVVYDREQLQRIGLRYGDDAVLGIFAHEMGHAWDSTYGRLADGPVGELSADYYAGCLLGVLGASTGPLVAFLADYGAADAEHPPAEVRQRFVEHGHQLCSGLWR